MLAIWPQYHVLSQMASDLNGTVTSAGDYRPTHKCLNKTKQQRRQSIPKHRLLAIYTQRPVGASLGHSNKISLTRRFYWLR
jgi:hypothetical protein